MHRALAPIRRGLSQTLTVIDSARPMRSLKKLNQAAGTSFTRWAQVVGILSEHRPVPVPEIDLTVCDCECGCRAPLPADFVFKIPVCDVCSMNVHMAEPE